MSSVVGIVAAILLSVALLTALLVVYWYITTDVGCLRGTYSFRPIGLAPDARIEIGMSHESYIDSATLPGFFILLLLLHEDDLFFAHRGVNVREVRNRVKAFLSGRDALRGGSSISQQLAKHVFNPNRQRRMLLGWIEKTKELVITKKLEWTFSKREILSLYLSAIRLGFYPAFGVRRAAWTYFAKSPEQISLPEALFLCGLIPRPKFRAVSIFWERKSDEYPLTNAFVKCVDLFRLLAKSYGWRTLDDVGQLSFRDVECLAREMGWYTPEGLPSELELALEQRALIEVARLKELIVELSGREPPVFSKEVLSEIER